jgi:hypothetical protein
MDRASGCGGASQPRLVLRLIEDRTHEGRRFRMLNVIDEFSYECLAIRVPACSGDRRD